MGDRCGHKNAILFDAVQRGRDGFDSAAFAGTNAVFCREAFDSIGGIEYVTQTEDAFTGTWSTLLVGTQCTSARISRAMPRTVFDVRRSCSETVAAAMG